MLIPWPPAYKALLHEASLLLQKGSSLQSERSLSFPDGLCLRFHVLIQAETFCRNREEGRKTKFSCVLTKRLSAFSASLLSSKKANSNSYSVPSERRPGDRFPRQQFPGVSVTRQGPGPQQPPPHGQPSWLSPPSPHARTDSFS